MRYLIDDESIDDDGSPPGDDNMKDAFRHKFAGVLTIVIVILGIVILYLLIIK